MATFQSPGLASRPGFKGALPSLLCSVKFRIVMCRCRRQDTYTCMNNCASIKPEQVVMR